MVLTAGNVIDIFNIFNDEILKPRKETKEIQKFYSDQFIRYLKSKYKSLNRIKFVFEERKSDEFKRELLKYYYPINSRVLGKNGEIEISHKEIIEVLNSYSESDERHFFLKSSAGSGKTTFLKHVYLQSVIDLDVRHQQGEDLNTRKLPIFIELRDLNSFIKSRQDFQQIDFEDYLINIISFNDYLSGRGVETQKYLKLKNLFRELLNDGKYIFLFDGLDEVDDYDYIKISIKNFTQKYFKNSFIISSRENHTTVHLPTFTHLKLKDLFVYPGAVYKHNDKSIEGTVQGYLKFYERKRLINTTPKLYEKLQSIANDESQKKTSSLKSILTSPLMASYYYLVFRESDITTNTMVEFSKALWDALLIKHDKLTKPELGRKFQSGLNSTEIFSVIQSFCYILYQQDVYSFTKKKAIKLLHDILQVRSKNTSAEAVFYDLVTTLNILKVEEEIKEPKYTLIFPDFHLYFVAQRLAGDVEELDYFLLEGIENKKNYNNANLLDFIKESGDVACERMLDIYLNQIFDESDIAQKILDTDDRIELEELVDFFVADNSLHILFNDESAPTGYRIKAPEGSQSVISHFIYFFKKQYNQLYSLLVKIIQQSEDIQSDIVVDENFFFENEMFINTTVINESKRV